MDEAVVTVKRRPKIAPSCCEIATQAVSFLLSCLIASAIAELRLLMFPDRNQQMNALHRFFM
jgi:hypothetical protein